MRIYLRPFGHVTLPQFAVALAVVYVVGLSLGCCGQFGQKGGPAPVVVVPPAVQPPEVKAPGPPQNIEQRIGAKVRGIPQEQLKKPVRAKDFIRDWQENRLFAQQAYQGKMIVFSGFVYKVDKSFGSPFVDLDNGKDFTFSSVRCYCLASETDDLLPLVKGDVVQVYGKCASATAIRECKVLMTTQSNAEYEAWKKAKAGG